MSWQQVCFDYDGSYPGFLTCVFESYAHREEAVCFTSPEEDRLTLWPERHVDTDQAKAERVYRSLSKKISPQACRLVTQAFLTCLPERELHMYRFLRLGYQRGADITRDLTDDRVHVLWKAVQHLGSEAHLLKGFLRFSDQQGVLVGEIEPKNRVLPLLRPHFCTRYSGEHFLIYDRTHRELLIHQPGRWAILPAEDFAPAPPGQEEVTYRRLWRRFYDTIAIRERENPRCRMNHMQKKYWKNMVEMTLPPTPDDIALPTRPLTSPLPTRENAAIGAVQPRQAANRRAHLPAGNGLPDIDASPPISEEDGQHEPHVQSLKQR